MPTSAKLIKKILLGINKENLLLAYYSHFKPALEKGKSVARVSSINFENSVLKDETTELASIVTTSYNFF